MSVRPAACLTLALLLGAPPAWAQQEVTPPDGLHHRSVGLATAPAPRLMHQSLGGTAPEVSPLAFSGLGHHAAIPTGAMTFRGFGQTDITEAPTLRLTGWGAENATRTAPLSLSGLGRTEPRAPALTFTGLSTVDPTAPQLAFSGLAATPPSAADLHFTGLGTVLPAPEALVFAGWGRTSQYATAPLTFTGWAADNAPSLPALTFTGVGPSDPVITSEDFSGGTAGFTTNDGPASLFVDSTGALCFIDMAPGDLTVTLPPAFSGDWGGPGGQLEFFVYYNGPTQWPLVITLFSPAGTATFRDGLTGRDDGQTELISRPLDEIWWEEDGDWAEIIRSIERVEIDADIRYGTSEAADICIDDVILTRIPAPRL